MEAFDVLDEVLGDYESFVKAFLGIQDERVRDEVEKEIQDGRCGLSPDSRSTPRLNPAERSTNWPTKGFCIPKPAIFSGCESTIEWPHQSPTEEKAGSRSLMFLLAQVRDTNDVPQGHKSKTRQTMAKHPYPQG